VPPRRPTQGRHRRSQRTAGPAYLTAATLAAFAVSGLNVPEAIGDVRAASSLAPSAATATAAVGKHRAALSAVQLRTTLAKQQDARASRLRAVRVEGVRLSQKAAEKARKAAEAARPKWTAPVLGYRLTAGFGDYGLWSSAHTGQDFAAPAGAPVLSIGDGTIVSAEYEGAYGYKLIIRHAEGTVSWYAHLSSFARTEGTVLAGEMVGRVGSTGNSTGDHLHLEVRPGPDSPVPPLTWLRQHGVEV